MVRSCALALKRNYEPSNSIPQFKLDRLLVFIRDKLKHNWERSQEMFESIKQVGWGDSVEVVDKIIGHLLSVGEGVTVETSVRHPSRLEAPNGALEVKSTWKILPDGTKYLTTINFIPVPKE